MNLKLVRDTFTKNSTIGKLYIDGVYFCETLEDVDRKLTSENVKDVKVFGETAIPEGIYSLILSYSPRFKKLLPLLLNVPGFLGIRIHAGNTKVDTHGCILVGESRETDKILRSVATMAKLMKLLQAANKKQKITIEVTSLTSN